MRRSASLLMGIGVTLLSLATIGGAPARASTPGTNGSIVFAADLGLGFQLYMIKPSGTGFHQVTNVPGDALQPDWSPDGTLIAFEHDFELNGEDNGRIGIVNADGSDAHDISPGGVFAGQPAFTPDGDHLVYECASCVGGDGIYLMAADGSDFPGCACPRTRSPIRATVIRTSPRTGRRSPSSGTRSRVSRRLCTPWTSMAPTCGGSCPMPSKSPSSMTGLPTATTS